MALERIRATDRKTVLNQELVTRLEEMLDTTFSGLDEFFALDNDERTFDVLAENYSDIYLEYGFYFSSIDEPGRPVSVFPPLLMSYSLRLYDGGSQDYFINFQADGKKHEILVEYEYPEVTFDEINEHMKSRKFIQFYLGSWFMVPKDLNTKVL